MKAANRGLVDKAMDAIAGVIKTIIQLKNMLLGVLAKAADVIGDIIADPIGFLGKLIDGIKAGLSRFVGNIATHLQEGLMGWLFGALGGAGITLPKTFDIAGIFDLVMQVLGLTYRNIRARVVKLVGEPVVARLEQTVDVFKVLVTEGVGGLWRWIKDKVGDLEELVLGRIKTFIIEKVIKAGITWLIAFLNPAAAFIKACKVIYDIVMFIIERGSEIMEFVRSILDSVGAIAKGAIGVVAEKVEGSLAKALPLAISFLASLLGLGGISEKIHSIIEKVQAPIGKAVDFVVMGAVKGAKKLFGGAAKWSRARSRASRTGRRTSGTGQGPLQRLQGGRRKEGRRRRRRPSRPRPPTPQARRTISAHRPRSRPRSTPLCRRSSPRARRRRTRPTWPRRRCPRSRQSTASRTSSSSRTPPASTTCRPRSTRSRAAPASGSARPRKSTGVASRTTAAPTCWPTSIRTRTPSRARRRRAAPGRRGGMRPSRRHRTGGCAATCSMSTWAARAPRRT